MRRRLLILAVLLAAGAAQAAAPPPASPSGPPPAPAARSPATPPALSFTPSPANTGLGGGLITSLASPADAAAQCRAACSKARYRCAPDDTACDNRWTQCLAACR